MELPSVLSLSTDHDPTRLRARAKALQLSGFDVVSVNSASQAEFEISMGQCGVFVSCPLLSDYSTGEMFKLFKKYCPAGLTVFVIRASGSDYMPPADIRVDESCGPNGIAAAIVARLRESQIEPTELADTG